MRPQDAMSYLKNGFIYKSESCQISGGISARQT